MPEYYVDSLPMQLTSSSEVDLGDFKKNNILLQ